MILERPALRLSQLRAASPTLAKGLVAHARRLARRHQEAQRSVANEAAECGALLRGGSLRAPPPSPFLAALQPGRFPCPPDGAFPVAAASGKEHQTQDTSQRVSGAQEPPPAVTAKQGTPQGVPDRSPQSAVQQAQSPSLPPPEPAPLPLFSYLQSLFVEPFDILMGNANGRADYMSTEMHVRRLSPSSPFARLQRKYTLKHLGQGC